MSAKFTFTVRTLLATLILLAAELQNYAHAGFHPNNTNKFQQDTTKYPITDRRGDPYTYPNTNSFDLKDTSFIKRTVEYDPVTKQ